MDLLITGIPGPLLKWTSELVKTVAKPVRPAVALGGSGADASPAQSAGSDPDVLVAGHLDPKHEAAVLAGTLRAVVVVGDAGTCLAAQQSSGKRLVNALRDLINCATPFGRLAGCRNVHVVTRH